MFTHVIQGLLPACSSSLLDDNDLPEVWDCSDEEDEYSCTNTNEYSCTSNEHQDTSQRISSTHSLIKFVVIFLLSWQAIFRISNIAVDVLFKFIGVLLVNLLIPLN